MGRHGNKRSPAAALRFFLFEQTKWGYWMDVTQATFSVISCLMFISVAYAAYDPESVQDIEFFFTCYFFADYLTRCVTRQHAKIRGWLAGAWLPSDRLCESTGNF